LKICIVNGCNNEVKARGYCNKHYQHVKSYGTPELIGHKRPINFEIDENECFNCTSHHKVGGYPKISWDNKKMYLSRFIYTEMFGDIPEGLVIRHKCDNPACINPEHLELGTVADNNHDRVIRGRGLKGEQIHRSILTENKVREIKKMLNLGIPQKDIAEKFNIKDYVVSQIKNKRTWKHVI
jgi:hypothetical protein